MDTTTDEQVRNAPVEVDPGDLAEVQQAAEAWASYLRKRTEKNDAAAGPRDEAAADRIDAANHRLREQTYPAPGDTHGD